MPARVSAARKVVTAARHKAANVPIPRSVDELDLDSPAHHLPQRLRVPIGEAHAAVRFGLADVLRLRGAVDAEAIAEVDPGVADRIVGAGGDVEGLFRLHSFELWLGWGVV